MTSDVRANKAVQIGAYSIATLALGTMQLMTMAQETKSPPTSVNLRTPATIDDLETLQDQVTKALRHVLTAVVAVGGPRNPDAETATAVGRFATGIIIRADGLILSQYHVSHKGVYDDRTGLVSYGEPGESVDVILHNGRRVEAELLGGDRAVDLSLLRIREPDTYPFAPLADNESVSLGEWVVKPGHPAGYQKSRGIVSRLGRVVYQNRVNVIPDCMTAGGDSGGPIVNLDGQVVGILADSFIPESVMLAGRTVRRDSLRAFSTVSKIQEKMATMLASRVPRMTDFREHEQRREQFEQVLTMLPPEVWTSGEEVMKSWEGVTSQIRMGVVEVLDAQQRTAYGTVVSSDGWILTKASEISETPRCRLPNGEIVRSRVAGVDTAFDLAMLQVDAAGLEPVQWSTKETYVPGTFVVAPGIAGRPIAAGIISAGRRQLTDRLPATSPFDGFPAVFDHDIALSSTECGGPVLGLNGKALGITIARVGPHGCVAIPSDAVLSVIERLQQ